MKLCELTKRLSQINNKKNETQRRNLDTVARIAIEFHKNSDSFTNNVNEQIKLLRQNEDITVIEVAHQPNFMPYYGVWKKAVLADNLASMLNKERMPAVALFGFVDTDTTMNPYLSRNKIPYDSKEGYKNIGFKIKGENEWWRLWCKQPLPPSDEIKKQIDFIRKTYTDHGLSNIDKDWILIEKLFKQCYLRDCTFSKANAKFFSIVCNRIFGLSVIFFNYSEAQNNNVFTDQFEYLLSKRKTYIEINNEIIKQKKLDLEKMSDDHVPFWYHCECGGKVHIKINETNNILFGICPICKNYIEKSIGTNFDLSDIYKLISFEAISRELIVPNSLGTDIYIEGSGGSLSFRQISNIIANQLNFKNPLSFRWKSKDKYISLLIHKAINDFEEKYPIASIEQELTNIKITIEKLSTEIEKLDNQHNTLKNDLNNYKPGSDEFISILELSKDVDLKRKKVKTELARHSSILSKIQGLSSAYIMTPSILDEILSVGFNNVLKSWFLDLNNNDFDIEHTLNLPVKKINGINHEFSMTTFLELLGSLNKKIKTG